MAKKKSKKKKKKSVASNDFVRLYLFWVLGSVTLVAGLVCWFLSTGSLKQQFQTNKRGIEKSFAKVSKVSSTEDHPNPKTNENLTAQSKLLAKRVGADWQKLYQRQKTEILIWPKALGSDFTERVEGFPPIEQIELPQHEISPNMRERYRNYIEKEIKKLPLIIGDVWATKSGRGAGRDAAGSDKRKVLCRWKDQEDAHRRLIVEGNPLTRKILYTQEDLWVYQALLRIIRKTNEASGAFSADDHHKAALQEIHQLKIANDAPSTSSSPRFKKFIGVRKVEDENGNEGQGDNSKRREFSDTQGASGGGDGELKPHLKLIEGRYVDDKGRPLRGKPVEKLVSDEYKRMPIYMRLTVDQRHIDRLLVECANSPLTVEVRQLSLSSTKPKDDGPQIKLGGIDTRGGAEKRTGENKPRRRKTDRYKMLEIYGVIYLFNPLDPEKLNLPKADESQPGQPEKSPAKVADTRTN